MAGYGKNDKLVSGGYGANDREITPVASAAPVTPVTPEKPGKWDNIQPGSHWDSVFRGATQAATLGFGDEIQAFLRSNMPGADSYETFRDSERTANTAASNENPIAYLGGQVLGGLASGGAVGSVKAGAPLAVKAGVGAVNGGVIGGVQGAGYSEANTAGGVAKDALTGGAINAVVGGAIPLVRPAAGAVHRAGTRGSQASLVNPLKDVTPVPTPTPSIISSFGDGLGLPGIGAMGNIYRANSGEDGVDYNKDWLSAGINSAKAGIIGAGTGYAVSRGVGALPAGAKYAAGALGAGYTGAKAAINKLPPIPPNIVDKVAGVIGPVRQETPQALAHAVPMTIINNWLSGKNVTNPAVEQVAKQADQELQSVGPAGKKAIAMKLDATKEGRAITNTDSPTRGGK